MVALTHYTHIGIHYHGVAEWVSEQNVYTGYFAPENVQRRIFECPASPCEGCECLESLLLATVYRLMHVV